MDEPKPTSTFPPGLIIVVAGALMGIGLVMVASATLPVGPRTVGPWSWGSAFGRQMVFASAGLALAVATRFVAPSIFARPNLSRRVCQAALVIAVAGLVAALIPSIGSEHHGSQRWLHFGAFPVRVSVQPSEIAKLAMVAMLAAVVSPPASDRLLSRRRFLLGASIVGVCCVLVGKEDFGTAVLLACVGMLVLLVAGCKIKHLFALAVGGTLTLAVLLFAAPYRIARVVAFCDIWADPRGAGYQPLQSLTAIARGGWMGVGLGAGLQKHGYLPESHSDFVFSLICEETGFLGAALVIGLFLAFCWLGIRTTWTAPNPFERILAFGICALVTLQAVMNIAVAVVVTPTTGISLPFVSAGGSGLLTFSIAAGVLAAIAARANGHGRPCPSSGWTLQSTTTEGVSWTAVH